MVVGLNIQDQDVNGTKVVRLEGRLDAVSSTMLENKLKEIETKKFKSLQGSFSLFAIHENVMEIIKMAGFERILSIYPHEKEALNGAASHKH
jgi:anti-anti-sigma regulatory factor